MKEFLNSIKDFIRPIVKPVAELLGVRNLFAGLIIVGVAVLLVVAVVVSIVCAVKSKKRKKQALEEAQAKANEEKVKQNGIVQQAAIKEKVVEPVNAEPVPVVEVKEEPKAVEPAPAEVAEVKEEPKAVEPAPAEVAEVKEEQPAVEPVKAEPKQEVKEEVKAEPKKAEENPAPVKEEVKEDKAQVQPVNEEAKAPAKKPAAKKAPAKKTLNGKWVVELKSLGEFMSKLLASNGEVMLSSEIYSSEEGARAGIATIIKWVEEGNFVVYQDKKKNYYYKLKTSGNRLICVGEIYKSKEQCLSAVESVKRIAKGAIVSEELVEGARYIDYKPAQFDENAKGPKGKWKVETLDDGKFSARLYASNGQLMIATEEVATKKTALNAIDSVKKNSIEGNFIVDRDKFGRYYYKLRNAQKSVICIGEAYDSLDACTKALESVRRFAVNSIVIPE